MLLVTIAGRGWIWIEPERTMTEPNSVTVQQTLTIAQAFLETLASHA